MAASGVGAVAGRRSILLAPGRPPICSGAAPSGAPLAGAVRWAAPETWRGEESDCRGAEQGSPAATASVAMSLVRPAWRTRWAASLET